MTDQNIRWNFRSEFKSNETRSAIAFAIFLFVGCNSVDQVLNDPPPFDLSSSSQSMAQIESAPGINNDQNSNNATDQETRLLTFKYDGFGPAHAPAKDGHYTYEYGFNGALKRKFHPIQGQETYKYNHHHKLSRVQTFLGDQFDYLYDARGNRIAKNVNDGEDIERYFAASIEKRGDKFLKFFFAGTKRLAEKGETGDLVFYHQDHLGSTSTVTNRFAQVVTKRTYYEFGAQKESFEFHKADHSYNDKRLEKQTKLLDYHARQYAPSLFQFTQPDTIIPEPNNPQSYNRFAYVENNPLRFIDPSGHIKITPPEGVDYYLQAKRAIIEQAPFFASNFAELERLPETYLIVTGSFVDDFYSSGETAAGRLGNGKLMILWDPGFGIQFDVPGNSEKGYVTPALALGHEIGHILRQARGEHFIPAYQVGALVGPTEKRNIEWGVYDNLEEYETAVEFEHPLAIAFGQHIRAHHHGSPAYFNELFSKTPFGEARTNPAKNSDLSTDHWLMSEMVEESRAWKRIDELETNHPWKDIVHIGPPEIDYGPNGLSSSPNPYHP